MCLVTSLSVTQLSLFGRSFLYWQTHYTSIHLSSNYTDCLKVPNMYHRIYASEWDTDVCKMRMWPTKGRLSCNTECIYYVSIVGYQPWFTVMPLADDASEKLRETKDRSFLPMRSMSSAVALASQAQRSLTEPLGLPEAEWTCAHKHTHTLSSFCVSFL